MKSFNNKEEAEKSGIKEPLAIPQQPVDDEPSTEVFVDPKTIDYPVVVIGGYPDDPNYGAAFTITVDDPALSELEDYPLESDALDSNVTVEFVDGDSNETKTLVLPYGVVVVFGQTRSGKSELLKYILKQTGGTYVRFMEAETPAMTDPHRFSKAIKKFLQSKDGVVFGGDSFRHLMYASKIKSAAGKGGVNTGIYGDLTALSIVAAQRKKIILAVVNPATDDDLADVMALGIEGAVSGMFIAKGYGRCKFVARTQDNMRSMRVLSYSPEDKKSAKFGRLNLNMISLDPERTADFDINSKSDVVASKIGRVILRSRKI